LFWSLTSDTARSLRWSILNLTRPRWVKFFGRVLYWVISFAQRIEYQCVLFWFCYFNWVNIFEPKDENNKRKFQINSLLKTFSIRNKFVICSQIQLSCHNRYHFVINIFMTKLNISIVKTKRFQFPYGEQRMILKYTIWNVTFNSKIINLPFEIMN
jgi:hypothetical protein